MGDKSAIEWTDATWNPVTGCTKVSQGCKNCYAETLAKRLWAYQYPPNADGSPRKFTDIRLHPERLELPLRWKRPRHIFVNSVSDLFHESLHPADIVPIFNVMYQAKQHIFQILTKRSDRMLDFATRLTWSNQFGTKQYLAVTGRDNKPSSPVVLPNVWLGTSIEDQITADERIPTLLQTPAAVRFVSCEPLLGPIDLSHCVEPDDEDWEQVNLLQDENDDFEPEEYIEECEAELDWINYGNDLVYNPEHREWVAWRRERAKLFSLGRQIDWVIVGGESGTKARPMHPDWARSLRDECQAAGVKFFFKQWGAWAPVESPEKALDGPNQKPLQWVRGREKCGYYCDEEHGHIDHNEWLMEKVGKKAAGRLLDGRTWDEYPEVG